MLKDIFHTLTFRNNNLEVLNHGPYICNRKDAWLSPGFYFWEESIKAAHYWGVHRLKKDYIIFQANCTIDENNCFDLVSSPRHVDHFRELFDELVSAGYANTNSTVGHVIDFLRKSGNFPYPSSRIESTNAFQYYVEDNETRELKFDKKLTYVTLKLHLVIQICIFDLEQLNFQNFQLAYDSTEDNKGA